MIFDPHGIQEKPDAFAAWPRHLCDELSANGANGKVGSRLVSETDDVRVWRLRLEPGARFVFHRHVLDYFWTALSDGRAISHYGDGSIKEVSYRAGDTRHFNFAAGESMVHELHNTGAGDLVFVTVEFKNGKNPPLTVG